MGIHRFIHKHAWTFSAILVIAGGAMLFLFPEPQIQHREFASVSSLAPQTRHYQVALRAAGEIPSDETEEAVLVGWVRVNPLLAPAIHYRWELPADVEMIDGRGEDRWDDTRKGVATEVRIKVRGFSKESRKLITLHVDDGDGGDPVSAVLTSRPEDSYEMLGSASSPVR